MAKEVELNAFLDKQKYQELIKTLENEAEFIKAERRIKISCWNPDRNTLVHGEVRVNQPGDALVVFKSKNSKITDSVDDMEEYEGKLVRDAKSLLEISKGLGALNNSRPFMMRVENRYYQKDNIEYKPYIQIGNKGIKKYLLEIESLKHNAAEIEAEAKRLEVYDSLFTEDAQFWADWNKEMNVYIDELSDTEIIEILNQYL